MSRNCDLECSCPCHLGNPRMRCECYSERVLRAPRAARRATALPAPAPTPRKAPAVPDVRRDGRTLQETAIEAYLDTCVRRKGGRTFKIAAVYEKGVPDRLVLAPWGRQYLVEMKKADGIISPAQSHLHDTVLKMGHVVHVLSSKNEVEAFVRWMVMTGPGLRNAKSQHALDLKAVRGGYYIPDRDSSEDLEALL